ncbi:MAG: nucleotidyltransferase domain-containing protein [Chloroflexi bacterium]|nr:nucleotidyltransferase domain-containing protein [Chloroflexota bacterium]
MKQWLANHEDILAVLLVGSFARGTAHDESDIDLILICETPWHYLGDNQWPETFGHMLEIQHEDWGPVQSKCVFYENGLEVEFGLTTAEWAAISPVDSGTQAVIADGAQIVSDPQGMLAALVGTLNHD